MLSLRHFVKNNDSVLVDIIYNLSSSLPISPQHTVQNIRRMHAHAYKMNHWVSDCCLTPTQQFFQLYHVENKLIVNEMMMRSALY